MSAGIIYGPRPDAVILAAAVCGGLLVTLALLQPRRRPVPATAGWHRGPVHLLTGDLAAIGRLGNCERLAADAHRAAAEAARGVTIIEAGLQAAFDAAGLSGPRPVLKLVPRRDTQP